MKRVFEDGWLSDGRRPVLWIVHGGKVYRFAGVSIPGVVQVCEEWAIEKAYARTKVRYVLELAEGAVACELLAFLSQRLWPEGALEAAFSRFKRQYGVSGLTLRAFTAALKRNFPLTFKRMTAGEEAPNSVDWEWSSRRGKK